MLQFVDVVAHQQHACHILLARLLLQRVFNQCTAHVAHRAWHEPRDFKAHLHHTRIGPNVFMLVTRAPTFQVNHHTNSLHTYHNICRGPRGIPRPGDVPQRCEYAAPLKLTGCHPKTISNHARATPAAGAGLWLDFDPTVMP